MGGVTAYLLTGRNVGGDAAGRGAGSLLGLFLTPMVVVAGGLLFWGWRGGPVVASLAGSALVLLPTALAIGRTIKGNSHLLGKWQRARDGHFSDAKLRELAQAMDTGDSAAVRRLAGDPTLNRQQRDPLGRTILGHALIRAGDPSNGTPAQMEALRLLLSAPPSKWDEAALDPDGHSLARIAAAPGEKATAIVALGLQHGANPNGLARSGIYPLIFDPEMDLARVKLLAQHGANIHALAPKSAGGSEGWTLLMCAVDRRRFALAKWLLDQDVNHRHAALDGQSLETLLSDSNLVHTEAPAASDPEERQFIDALRTRRGRP